MFIKLFLFSVFIFCSGFLRSFEKVVIWGHKIHTHTHSYIHNAFFRAFQEMGYPVFWMDNADDVSNFDFANTLFLTEGQVDQKIPVRNDCQYILHNCEGDKYGTLFERRQAFTLQVYTDDVIARAGCKRVSPCIYQDIQGLCLYMPWATDLLPREIDEVKRSLPHVKRTDHICWVGTIGGGEFGNVEELDPFIRAAQSHGYSFQSKSSLSMWENLDFVRSSYMAPAIVGRWQQKQGYIPCRIFKNISYGKMGITNSPRVHELFEGRIVYNSDCRQLFYDAEKKIHEMSQEELYALMDFVRDNHTYINRIKTLLDFLQVIQHGCAGHRKSEEIF